MSNDYLNHYNVKKDAQTIIKRKDLLDILNSRLGLLSKDPSSRLTMSELKQSLNISKWWSILKLVKATII